MIDKEDLIKQNIEKIDKIIDVFCDKRKEKVKEVFEKIGMFYFSAPASSKEEYHYSFPGGLAAHSINVFKNLMKLNDTFQMGFDTESMVVCSLFHDLGKCCNSDLSGPFYKEQTEKWRKEKLGQNYEFDYGSVYFPTHQRTMIVLQSLGFQLKPEEYQAILLNDGQYIDENKSYRQKETDLALFIHMADMISSRKEKEEKQAV